MTTAVAALQLRPVREQDERVLFHWANQPEVRAAAFQQKAISWDSHQIWLRQQLSSSDRHLYIAELGETPVGQVRFGPDKIDPEVAIIDVSIDAKRRRAGLGSLVITCGTQRLFSEGNYKAVMAVVKSWNRASLAAFGSAGYVRLDERLQGEEIITRFIARREDFNDRSVTAPDQLTSDR